MSVEDSAIALVEVAPPAAGLRSSRATWLGALGVLAFSMSLPATRAAVPALGAVPVGAGRAVVAAGLAGIWLWRGRARRPTRAQLRRLVIVALGVVLGFPLLSSTALTVVGSAHGAVIVGLIPIGTALAAVYRAGERPGPAFWASSAVGAAAVLGFAWASGAGIQLADLLLLGAVAAAAIGYAEGGALAREMPGWQVIGWALALALPVTVPVTVAALWWHPPVAPGPAGWLGFGYVSVVSMFLGFVPWYRGLALGGVARIGQLQLAQPVLTLIWSVLLLRERIDATMMIAAAAVLVSTAATQRVRWR
ncbi:MAG: DMT family transporter [Actinobacteria bacterium]|nr:DMT family transporter [Actinomycetota bacterium]MBI3688045.1 DMT family transporter [Actinomycetota bacterium]